TDIYNAGNLTFTLAESKNYCISARVQADDGFTVVKNLFISVKDGVINIAPTENLTGVVGREIILVAPEAKDFYGNAVTGGSFSVLFNGERIEVKNGAFVPKDLGVYKVTYSVSLSGFTQTCEYEYKVVDNESPEIVLRNKTEKTAVGKFVKINGYSVGDNSGKDLAVKVEVTFGGEPVAVYNGGFDADRKGEYEIRITATDMSGNTATKLYRVTASGKGCSSSLYTDITFGYALLSFFFAAVLFRVKKHNRIKK
ncbi:MAG: hypothetical protein IJU84_08765, partial [Clostridia bacterium]|nr:hypothetical protein [Clostridia bacterium]